MSDEVFRVNPEEVAGQTRGKYNWSRMSPIYLAPMIVVDAEIALELGEAIRQIVKKIAESHDKPLQKVEVVRGSPSTDLDNATVFVRWTSSQGVWEREFQVYKTIVSKMVMHPHPSLIRR